MERLGLSARWSVSEHRGRHVGRAPDRILTVAVVAVWALALVLGAAYLLTGRDTTSNAAAIAGETAVSRTPTTRAASPGAASTSATSTTIRRRSLTVVAGGDVIGDRKVGDYIDAHGGEAVLDGVAPLFADADVAFVNLESPLSDKGTRNAAKDVTFRGRPALVDGLAAAGVGVVSLANNHALDWGSEALLDTIARLDGAGIAHAGAGVNLSAARAPALLETGAGTVALLAYTNVVPEGFPAGDQRAGVNPMRPDTQRILADIGAAAESADWVIVSVHWGIEYEGETAHEQRVFAHDFVDAGADLVLGHHPHVLQGLELYRNKLIAYSLGDFVFDHYSRATGEAFVLSIQLAPAGPPSLTVSPVYLSDGNGIPQVVGGAEADGILTRLSAYSKKLGLTLTRDGDRASFSPT
ncbi:MAG: CapA family protein [Thermoleophilia bacterium]|nr:CapA family protein [Thermoleophilia bacterium]